MKTRGKQTSVERDRETQRETRFTGNLKKKRRRCVSSGTDSSVVSLR